MTRLTREEWEKVAESLGMTADKFKEFIDLIMSFQLRPEEALEEVMGAENEEIQSALLELRKLEETMRLAIGAVLWVSENAADKVRFMMLDSHPPDEA